MQKESPQKKYYHRHKEHIAQKRQKQYYCKDCGKVFENGYFASTHHRILGHVIEKR